MQPKPKEQKSPIPQPKLEPESLPKWLQQKEGESDKDYAKRIIRHQETQRLPGESAFWREGRVYELELRYEYEDWLESIKYNPDRDTIVLGPNDEFFEFVEKEEVIIVPSMIGRATVT